MKNTAVDYPEKSSVWVAPPGRVPDDPRSPGDPSLQRSHGFVPVVARIQTGRTFQAAQADMDAVAATLERDYPAINRNVGVMLTPGFPRFPQPDRKNHDQSLCQATENVEIPI